MLAFILMLVIGCGDSPAGPIIDPDPIVEPEPEQFERVVILQVLQIAGQYLTNALEIYRDPKRLGYTCVLHGESEFPWPVDRNFFQSLTSEVWECRRFEDVP